MKKSAFKLFVITCAIFTIFNLNLFAQPENRGPNPPDDPPQRNQKMMQKLQTLKKQKLLDLLNLDEAAADKFLIKYSSWEKKIAEKRNQFDGICDELRLKIKNKASADDIYKLTQNYISVQKEMFDLIQQKLIDMKSLLNEKEYAKYLIFEHEFMREFQRLLMEKNMKNKHHGKKMMDED